MPEGIKILVIGDVEGNFKKFFKKIRAAYKAIENLESVFCIGRFFLPDSDVRAVLNDLDVHLENNLGGDLYILGPCDHTQSLYFSHLKTDLRFRSSIQILSGVGWLGMASGLQVVYCATSEQASPTNDPPFLTESSIDQVVNMRLRSGPSHFQGAADICISSLWPRGVYDTSDACLTNSRLVTRLAALTRPRYHFSARAGKYWERAPYKNVTGSHYTRFVALGSLIGPNRASYAFTIVPGCKCTADNIDTTLPVVEVTEYPYAKVEIVTPGSKRSSLNSSQPWRWSQDSIVEQPKRMKTAEECWFCLSSPKVERHLVISVGSECYLALAKGQLHKDHMLIIPIQHNHNSIVLEEAAVAELKQYKAAITSYYASFDHLPVFFERNYKQGHLNIQCAPVPKDCKEFISDLLQSYSRKYNFKFESVKSGEEFGIDTFPNHPSTFYFYIELPDGKSYYYKIQYHYDFPINFGREFLCNKALLNRPGCEDWRRCVECEDTEKLQAVAIRNAFQPFDFTNND